MPRENRFSFKENIKDMNILNDTNYRFPNQKGVYKGKVRDVYNINNRFLIMIVSDRLSAFDVVLPKQIPYKGQILNQIAGRMLKATQDIVPNWVLDIPHPNVTIGYLCESFKVEMIVRRYMTGHVWRVYKQGKRKLCGITLPDGMVENQKFKTPIITPSTKANIGDHDQDISKKDILQKGIVSEKDYKILEKYTYALFERGTEIAAKQKLLLVDTKYEFGKTLKGDIVVIDEMHTPDSSRYFYADSYADLQRKGLPQKQLSKEFVRQWLIDNDFQGKQGQILPEITDQKVQEISNRYIELYEKITGKIFVPSSLNTTENHLEQVILECLKKIKS